MRDVELDAFDVTVEVARLGGKGAFLKGLADMLIASKGTECFGVAEELSIKVVREILKEYD